MEHRLHSCLGIRRSNFHARQLGDEFTRCVGRNRFDFGHRRRPRRGDIGFGRREFFAEFGIDLRQTLFGVARGLDLGFGDRLLRGGAAGIGLLAIIFLKRVGSGMGQLVRTVPIAASGFEI